MDTYYHPKDLELWKSSHCAQLRTMRCGSSARAVAHQAANEPGGHEDQQGDNDDFAHVRTRNQEPGILRLFVAPGLSPG